MSHLQDLAPQCLDLLAKVAHQLFGRLTLQIRPALHKIRSTIARNGVFDVPRTAVLLASVFVVVWVTFAIFPA